jgi:hypothetical protein
LLLVYKMKGKRPDKRWEKGGGYEIKRGNQAVAKFLPQIIFGYDTIWWWVFEVSNLLENFGSRKLFQKWKWKLTYVRYQNLHTYNVPADLKRQQTEQSAFVLQRSKSYKSYDEQVSMTSNEFFASDVPLPNIKNEVTLGYLHSKWGI